MQSTRTGAKKNSHILIRDGTYSIFLFFFSYHLWTARESTKKNGARNCAIILSSPALPPTRRHPHTWAFIWVYIYIPTRLIYLNYHIYYQHESICESASSTMFNTTKLSLDKSYTSEQFSGSYNHSATRNRFAVIVNTAT